MDTKSLRALLEKAPIPVTDWQVLNDPVKPENVAVRTGPVEEDSRGLRSSGFFIIGTHRGWASNHALAKLVTGAVNSLPALLDVMDALQEERRARVALSAARHRHRGDEGHRDVADAGTWHSMASATLSAALNALEETNG